MSNDADPRPDHDVHRRVPQRREASRRSRENSEAREPSCKATVCPEIGARDRTRSSELGLAIHHGTQSLGFRGHCAASNGGAPSSAQPGACRDDVARGCVAFPNEREHAGCSASLPLPGAQARRGRPVGRAEDEFAGGLAHSSPWPISCSLRPRAARPPAFAGSLALRRRGMCRRLAPEPECLRPRMGRRRV